MTAAMAPPACRCGLTMRPCDMTDAWKCRCGMTLDAEAAYAARRAGQPMPDAAFQQGEPWKEPAPGLRVSNDFADIGPLFWEHTVLNPSVIDPAALARACADAFECSGLRYVAQVVHGRRLEIDGETLTRRRMYAVAPLGQEAAAIRGIVQAIRGIDGPGRLWARGDAPVEPWGHRGGELGGVMHVVLACYYFHQPEPTR